MANRICVYAISKNESKNVVGFVENMSEADAIVVLDTGSTDKTVALLRQAGVPVWETTYPPGTFRFDVARNDAMRLVPDDCNILVAMDLDERLDPGWADYIRQNWIPGVHSRAVYSVCNGNETFARTMNWVHDRQWRWKYGIHEALVRDEPMRSEEVLDCIDHMTMRHFPDGHKPRTQYHDMLRQRHEENPEDAASWNYWIRHCANRGERDIIIRAVPEVERLVAVWNAPREAVCLYNYIADAYLARGDRAKAYAYYAKAIALYPRSRRAYIRYAGHLVGKHRWLDALPILEECERESVHDMKWTWLDDAAMWTWQLPYYKAACLNGLRRPAEALPYIEEAVAADPHNFAVRREYSNIKTALRNQ